jgi:pyruvate dehydrogenase E2 component (dihydrolipoamide acetyltransferase)
VARASVARRADMTIRAPPQQERAMPINILMPALSPTMEKGNVARWLKKEGDPIKSGDAIAEIETDKATMEVEAVDDGVLARILAPDGSQDVAVNQLIGVIATEGEDPASVGAAAKAGAGQPAPAKPTTSPAADAAAPRAETPAPRETRPAAAEGLSDPPPANGARVFASPLARRLAKEAKLDLSAIAGSGPHGRIIERDVRKAGESGASAPAQARAPSPAPGGMSDAMIRKFFEPGSFSEIPHDSMRRTIARRLVEAKQTIPHFYLTMDCELDALLALREGINAAAPRDKDGAPAYKVSVNDFAIKALALALMRVPDANVTWTESAMLKHQHADVGVAVSIPGGLITPVVRKAETKTLSVISNEMKDFAARARARKLRPDEYQGGATAVSNLGMFGVRNFSAVINPPHATILAVGAGEERVVVRNGAPAVATVMSVTLSTDHRAVDGALGAELLKAFKGFIERPMGMLA